MVTIAMLGYFMFPLSAQTTKKAEREKSIVLNQVVITGTGTHHKMKNTPVPVDVITANDIKKAGIRDFQSAMTMLVPSLSFSTNSMGSYLMMNGLGNKYVLILINGKKLIGDTANNVDLSRIDMNNVKRIEVLKGASSALYGSDAIAGVINIITDTPTNLLTFTSNSKIEEYGQFSQGLNLDISSKKVASSTSYNRQQANGWQLSNIDEAGKITDKVAIAGFGSDIISQKFTFTPNQKLSLYTEGSYYNKVTNRPQNAYDYDLGYEGYNLALGGKYKVNDLSSIHFDLANENYTSNYKYITKAGAYNIGDYKLAKEQHYYNATLKGIFKVNKKTQAVVGLEYINDQLYRPDASVDKSVYSIAAYAQGEFILSKNFQATISGRVTKHETAGFNFSPKASLMYSIGDLNLRTTYSGGFRAPGLDELYYYTIKGTTLTSGKSSLKSEKSHYYSINAEYISNCFSISATAYGNDILDMVNSKSTLLSKMNGDEKTTIINHAKEVFGDSEASKLTTYKEYQNLDRAKIYGFEVNANSYLGYGFSLGGSYAFADAKGKNLGGDWETIQRSIRHCGTINSNWKHDWKNYGLNVNLVGRIQSSRYHSASGIDQSAPGFAIWNINTRHTFDGFKNILIEPGFGVNNLFNYIDNRPYGVNYANLTPGRTIYISLLLKFKK